jgi:hypothetical protein
MAFLQSGEKVDGALGSTVVIKEWDFLNGFVKAFLKLNSLYQAGWTTQAIHMNASSSYIITPFTTVQFAVNATADAGIYGGTGAGLQGTFLDSTAPIKIDVTPSTDTAHGSICFSFDFFFQPATFTLPAYLKFVWQCYWAFSDTNPDANKSCVNGYPFDESLFTFVAYNLEIPVFNNKCIII